MIWWVPSLVSHYPSFSRWVGSPEQLRPSLLLPGARFQVRVSQVWKLPVCGTAHRCRPGGAPGRLFCSKKSPKVVGNSKCDLLIKGDVRVQRDGPAKLGMLQSLRLSSALERSTFEKKLFEKRGGNNWTFQGPRQVNETLAKSSFRVVGFLGD